MRGAKHISSNLTRARSGKGTEILPSDLEYCLTALAMVDTVLLVADMVCVRGTRYNVEAFSSDFSFSCN